MKQKSTFYPKARIENALFNCANYSWAKDIPEKAVEAAAPYLAFSDDELWNMVFSSTIPRSWMVLSYGNCPACGGSVPMYNWLSDPLKYPWKMKCPHCGDLFPKNDFEAFYRSGLDRAGEFRYELADRSLLYNTEHPDKEDPLHMFGVDDGKGYHCEGVKDPHLFAATYLVRAHWMNLILAAIETMSQAYVLTGRKEYAHKTAILLDRIADFFPDFDWWEQAYCYEINHYCHGFVSYCVNSCGDSRRLALAYDRIFDAIREDRELIRFLAEKAAATGIENKKETFADIQKNIEERIIKESILHAYDKNDCNFPQSHSMDIMSRAILDWPNNKEEVFAKIDEVINASTAADGVSGEKGLGGYASAAPGGVAELLSWFCQADESLLSEFFARYPKLYDLYTFHIDTWCMQKFYPAVGDCGALSEPITEYRGLGWCGTKEFRRSWLWKLYKFTGDIRFAQVSKSISPLKDEDCAPMSIFDANIQEAYDEFRALIEKHGTAIRQSSVNKPEWHLALLRAGEGDAERTAWISYDSGGYHGHYAAMNLGLFAKGMDLLVDLGYPPVQYGGGWYSPQAKWYNKTAAHNTVMVDGKDHIHKHEIVVPTAGKTTLWANGKYLRAMRFSAPELVEGKQYERGVYMVELGNDDFYLFDVFRVIGGKEHIKFQHASVGEAAAEGLPLTPITELDEPNGFMKNFRGGSAKPGWSADWNVRQISFSPFCDTEVHVRYTDLTEDAEGYLFDGWFCSGYDNAEDGSMTRAAVRRTSENEGLISNFVSVIEPYEANRTLGEIRRLTLDGASPQDCAAEVTRADGAKDLLLSLDREDPLGLRQGDGAVVQKDWNVRFRGDFCMVQKDADGAVCRIALCNAQELTVGDIVIDKPTEFAEIEVKDGKLTYLS